MKLSKSNSAASSLWRHARHIANEGDRWFLASAGRVGAWAQTGTGAMTRSALAAFDVDAERPPQRSTAKRAKTVPEPTQGAAKSAQASKSPSAGAHPSDCATPSASRFDVISGEPAENVRRSKKPEGELDAAFDAFHEGMIEPGEPAGVVPLLQALGKVVTEHQPGEYGSLQHDERFWMLVRVIESLAKADDGLGSTAKIDPIIELPAQPELVAPAGSLRRS